VESRVPKQLLRGDVLLKGGEMELAAEAYRDALRGSLGELTAAPQSVADSYVACFKAIQMAEAAQRAGKAAVAKAVGEDVLKALRTCQQVAPDWNPTIVTCRINKTEQLLAELK